MLPSTLVSLLLFILLLTPGFAYVLRTERTVPSRQFTTFRETMRVVVARYSASLQPVLSLRSCSFSHQE